MQRCARTKRASDAKCQGQILDKEAKEEEGGKKPLLNTGDAMWSLLSQMSLKKTCQRQRLEARGMDRQNLVIVLSKLEKAIHCLASPLSISLIPEPYSVLRRSAQIQPATPGSSGSLQHDPSSRIRNKGAADVGADA